MQQVTVGSKYQIVIPKKIRARIKSILPGSKLLISSEDDTITVRSRSSNWLARTKGMMKKAWQDIDTTKSLDNLRNEWDRKN